jgi:psp operon transcriptional activator
MAHATISGWNFPMTAARRQQTLTSKPLEAVGQSEAFLDFEERLSRVAVINRPVLLIGERGTGKELAASRLHYLSKRWDRPFVTLNCAALSTSLVESELFGHEAGAFTGADRLRVGRFEMAHGGTLFLDEIANAPLEVQEKILRVVEYGVFERVGGSTGVNADVRLIAAANVDLSALAAEGRFKRDLLDRLSFEVLFLPPLRDRKGDVMLLAGHFAARMAHEIGRAAIPEFSDEAIALLEAHPWPGNIRELKNVVERALYRAETDTITQIMFDPFASPYRPTSDRPTPPESAAPSPAPFAPSAPPADQPNDRPTYAAAMRTAATALLDNALRRARYNQRAAAKLLGLTYHQFRGLYRKRRQDLDRTAPDDGER